MLIPFGTYISIKKQDMALTFYINNMPYFKYISVITTGLS